MALSKKSTNSSQPSIQTSRQSSLPRTRSPLPDEQPQLKSEAMRRGILLSPTSVVEGGRIVISTRLSAGSITWMVFREVRYVARDTRCCEVDALLTFCSSRPMAPGLETVAGSVAHTMQLFIGATMYVENPGF